MHTIVMTGSSSGFGALAADRMLEHLDIILATHHRNAAPRPRHPRLDERRVDLADLDGVAGWAEALLEALDADDLPPLAAVVANAGVQVPVGPRRSAQGHELTFAVNHLAHVLLIDRLLPRLATDGRVVITSSGTHRSGDRVARLFGIGDPVLAPADVLADPAALGSRRADGMRQYATSKLANALHVTALAAEWPSLRVVAFDPGLTPATGLARNAPRPVRWMWSAFAPVLRRLPGANLPEVPAATLVDLALANTTVDSGAYVEAGRGVVAADPAAQDLSVARALLEDSRALVRPHVAS